MRFLAMTTAALLATGAAEAAVVRYDYIGAPQLCVNPDECGYGYIPGKTGWIEIDESLLLKNYSIASMNSVELSFLVQQDLHDEFLWHQAFSVSNPRRGESVSGYSSPYPHWPSFIAIGGDLWDALYPTVLDGGLHIKTDRGGQIIAWGLSGTVGGSWDWYISMGGDGSANAYNETAGMWLKDGKPYTPAVPLPASAGLMLAALAGLGVFRHYAGRSAKV